MLLRLTGLWEREKKNGDVFYGGNINSNMTLLVFKNAHKQKETDPDFVAYIGDTGGAKNDGDENGQIPF